VSAAADVIVKSSLDNQGVRCWEFSQSGWVGECDGDVATEDQKKQIEAHEDFCGWMDKCPKCCGVAEYCDCGEDAYCKKKWGVMCGCDDCEERREDEDEDEEEGEWCDKCDHFVIDDDHCCCKKERDVECGCDDCGGPLKAEEEMTWTLKELREAEKAYEEDMSNGVIGSDMKLADYMIHRRKLETK